MKSLQFVTLSPIYLGYIRHHVEEYIKKRKLKVTTDELLINWMHRILSGNASVIAICQEDQPVMTYGFVLISLESFPEPKLWVEEFYSTAKDMNLARFIPLLEEIRKNLKAKKVACMVENPRFAKVLAKRYNFKFKKIYMEYIPVRKRKKDNGRKDKERINAEG